MLLCMQCPESLRQSATQDGEVSRPTDIVTCRSLVRLHRRVITATQRHNCASLQWQCLLDTALDIEDVTLCDLSRHVFVPRIAATRAVIWRWINSPTLGEFVQSNCPVLCGVQFVCSLTVICLCACYTIFKVCGPKN